MEDKQLKHIKEIPLGGLISYPNMKDEKLFHIVSKQGHGDGEPMSAVIAEHVPYEVAINLITLNLRQSMCSHIAGDEDCPDKVFYHAKCECC